MRFVLTEASPYGAETLASQEEVEERGRAKEQISELKSKAGRERGGQRGGVDTYRQKKGEAS